MSLRGEEKIHTVPPERLTHLYEAMRENVSHGRAVPTRSLSLPLSKTAALCAQRGRGRVPPIVILAQNENLVNPRRVNNALNLRTKPLLALTRVNFFDILNSKKYKYNGGIYAGNKNRFKGHSVCS